MTRLIGVEFLKLRTQPAMRMLLLAALGLTLLGFVVFAVGLETNSVPGFDLSEEAVQRQILGTGAGNTLILVFAVIGITSEYRHRTITSAFLATPQRHKVIIAKLVTYAAVAAVYGVAVAAVTTFCVLSLLAIKDVALVVPWSTIVTDYLRDLGGLALAAGFGFAVGALVANQVAGIVIVLVEPAVGDVMSAFLPKIARFLPSQALTVLGSEQQFFLSDFSLSRTVAALVIVAYVVALMSAAIYVTARRDIT